MSSWPGVGALADDREPGGISELPSVEVLWLLTASLAGKGGELPSVEVLWLLTTSLAGTGCDDSILDRRVSGETEFGMGEYLQIMLDASFSPAVSPISLNRTACFDFLAVPAVFGLPSRFSLGRLGGGGFRLVCGVDFVDGGGFRLVCGVDFGDGGGFRVVGRKGFGEDCSIGFGKGVILDGALSTLALRPAGPCQASGPLPPFAVFALDSDIQTSVSATVDGCSLPCIFSHFELQTCRQWNRPQTSTDPTFGMNWVNRRTFSHSAYDARARLG